GAIAVAVAVAALGLGGCGGSAGNGAGAGAAHRHLQRRGDARVVPAYRAGQYCLANASQATYAADGLLCRDHHLTRR
ncbi:MAG: hypothetical protein ACYCYN_12165, partial [Solirubrobacteraceae bacterium]